MGFRGTLRMVACVIFIACHNVSPFALMLFAGKHTLRPQISNGWVDVWRHTCVQRSRQSSYVHCPTRKEMVRGTVFCGSYHLACSTCNKSFISYDTNSGVRSQVTSEFIHASTCFSVESVNTYAEHKKVASRSLDTQKLACYNYLQVKNK
jgi:hypothetical protein